MFEALLWVTIGVAVIGMMIAFDGSRDILHPLMFICPMAIFLYGWMPLRLLHSGDIYRFFDPGQLQFLGWLNLCGVICFIVGCLGAGVRIPAVRSLPAPLSEKAASRLIIGAMLTGGLGLLTWTIQIVNVGGVVNAFSKSYSGGWDDSGYVRDTAVMLLVGVLLALTAMARNRPKPLYLAVFAVFGSPWLLQAILTSRRGPTFALSMILAIGWYLNRNRRPPVILALAGGLALGGLVLLLVANRSRIYLGSDFDLKTDVSQIVEAPDTGNEYIYGSGAVLNARARGHYFWMRRYLAQIVVRPFPTAIWPTKYADFGVPELLHNAGTGDGFVDVLGWEGAIGSAPGIVADLWIEASWGCLGLMALLGWGFGKIWRLAVTRGGPWAGQYAISSALSMYLVMQTMEAVIFRTLLLSIPLWLVWRWTLQPERSLAVRPVNASSFA